MAGGQEIGWPSEIERYLAEHGRRLPDPDEAALRRVRAMVLAAVAEGAGRPEAERGTDAGERPASNGAEDAAATAVFWHFS